MHSSKSTECATPRMNPNVNYGLWVIMMCQHRFIHCNKCTALVPDVDGGEAVQGWVGGIPVNLKLL